MLFKDLKNGFAVYVYDKANVEYKQGKVLSVNQSHLDSKNPSLTYPPRMVVDVSVDFGNGSVKEYTLTDNTEIAYTESCVISTDKQNIVREIEASKNQSEGILAKVDYHKNVVNKCNSLLAEMDPSVKEKQIIDDRFNNLEKSISSISEALNKLLKTQSHENVLDNQTHPQAS